MLKQKLIAVWEFIRLVGQRFIKDRFTYSASALTYTTLLALVPLMAIGLSFLSAFPIFHGLKGQLQEFLFSNFVPAFSDEIRKYIVGFASQATKLSVFGTVFLAVTAIMLMLTIERALNDIWKIQQRRRGVPAFLLYWAILSLGPLFVGLSLAATTYVISIPIVQGAAESIGIGHFLVDVLPFVLSIVGLSLLYIVVPNCRVPWRYGVIGALVAALLFEVAKRAFFFYVTGFNTYQLLYGALASAPIFLIWLYVSWVIVLFGALISKVLATGYFERCGGRMDGFSHAFLWLGCLWQAQQQGKSLSLAQLYKQTPAYYDIQPEILLRKLIKAHLVKVTQAGTYMLARDLSRLTLADLYKKLPWRLPDDVSEKFENETIIQVFAKADKQLMESLDQPLADLYQKMVE